MVEFFWNVYPFVWFAFSISAFLGLVLFALSMRASEDQRRASNKPKPTVAAE